MWMRRALVIPRLTWVGAKAHFASMRLVESLSHFRLLFLLALFTAVLPSYLGCTGDTVSTDGAAVNALRQTFPEQAGNVLEQEEGFIETAEGFVAGDGASAKRRVEVELPRDAGGSIRIRVGSGSSEIRVRELGLEGEGVIAERAVAYRRAGGTSFWTAVPSGVEEWLHLEPGVAYAGEVVASWEVDGASIRQDGDAVEVVDESGWVRLRVTAPATYTAGGREVKAQVEERGGRIELLVDAGGEAVLVDPLWETVGSMNTGRDYHAATLLGNGSVLVTGGRGFINGTILASAELYDPVAKTWTAVAPMNTARAGHTAMVFGNKVLEHRSG